MKITCAAWLILTLATPVLASAQSVEVNDSNEAPAAVQEAPSTGPNTGKDKATGYFKTRKATAPRAASTGDGAAAPHVMTLLIGGFFTDQSYRWGEGDQKDPAKFNAGVTYRMGEWVNSMDLSLRLEYTYYSFDDGAGGKNTAGKLSIGPLITFPDANSKFPLYFGGGLGAGLFVQQLHDKSPLALDWQVVVGVRFMDVIQNMGFVVETGLKNHVLLTSEGQFNGVFINVGTVFDF